MEGTVKLWKKKISKNFIGQQDEGIRGRDVGKEEKCGDKYNSKTFLESVKSVGERVCHGERSWYLAEISWSTMEKKKANRSCSSPLGLEKGNVVSIASEGNPGGIY